MFDFISFLHLVLIYLVIFCGLMVEGEIVLFTAAILVHFGLLNYFGVLVVAFFGAWLGDMLWFLVGRRWGPSYFARHKYWLFLSKNHFERLMEYFKNGRGNRTIFISKFSYGLNHAVIVAAGASQMNFRKFIRLDSWITLSWVLIILSVVQILGSSFQHVKHITKDIGLGAAGVLIIFIVIEILVSKKAKV